jgi:hypothetical protein
VLVILVARIVAVFTENLNWDEFALLHRAELSARTGELMGGGRPGLATLLLLPLAANCRDAIDALIQARLFWTGIVLTSAVAFWLLLRAVVRPSEHRWAAVATGVGLWVLSPPFLRFSTQLRTDQPAVLFGLLGGLALVASRERTAWAALAGILFGIGFLFTQKLLYVAALAGVLAGGQLLINEEWQPRREAVRVLLTGGVFLLVIVLYRQLMATVAGPPAMLPVTGAMSTFAHYREAVGWSSYRRMLPSLIPQLLILLFLAVAAGDWLRGHRRFGRELIVVAAVLLVGAAVALFHAARFPYFYIVLGLFPAAMGALLIGPIFGMVARPQSRLAFLAMVWIPLALLAVGQAERLIADDQGHQRASLAFVARNFSIDAHGFNSRAAFACRQEANPFPTWFHEHVRARFESEPAAEENTRWLMQEFRSRPVAFMIPPLPWEPYPAELWSFWATRYVQYSGPVHVPGRKLRGSPGSSGTFEVILPGEYVWLPASPESGPIDIAGMTLHAGSTVLLDQPGEYRLALPEGGEGSLVLALPEPPTPLVRHFYSGW